MSAWDIAGAVVWTAVALVGLCILAWAIFSPTKLDVQETGGVIKIFALTAVASLGAVFCIARLFGAHP